MELTGIHTGIHSNSASFAEGFTEASQRAQTIRTLQKAPEECMRLIEKFNLHLGAQAEGLQVVER